MKKIDKLLIQSFVTPFVATFFISMFVLIMQFLWVYIDDIIGKGVGLPMIMELLFYSSCSLIPTALPIAVLISSVMVFGNLAEHYELSSLKSAGVPLLRVMAPLFILTVGVAIFSYFCANNVVPITNLKFKSSLYDIRKSKATLSLDEGIFNEDFKGFVIHIGDKDKDDKTIRDVIIYNHDYKYKNRLSIITAKTGEMYNTEDKRYFVMNLYDGVQYQEPEPSKDKKKKVSTFSRTYFREWNKVFDLSEFDIQDTDENRFKNNYSMLTYNQLLGAIDSLDIKIGNRYISLGNHLKRHFQPTKLLLEDSKKTDYQIAQEKRKKEKEEEKRRLKKERSEKAKKEAMENKNNAPTEVGKEENKKETTEDKVIKSIKKPKPKPKTRQKKKINPTTKKKSKAKQKKNPQQKKKEKKEKAKPIPIQMELDKPLTEYKSFLETLTPSKRERYINKTKSFTRGVRDQAQGAVTSLNYTKEVRVKHVYELNIKFSMAVVCVIFLFIGGPMGAIIRKGGFGYPILVAIFFFIVFMIMNIFFKKLAESFVVAPEWAPWLPCLILMPMGMILTHRAMNDMKMINIDRYQKFFNKVKQFIMKKKKVD